LAAARLLSFAAPVFGAPVFEGPAFEPAGALSAQDDLFAASIAAGAQSAARHLMHKR
jgi:hypothetical protein